MKKKLLKLCFQLMTLAIISGSSLLVSCKEDYELDEKEPTWLGASIYDYLKDDGDFTTYVRLIADEDVDYKDVLAKTGSKTLFVAPDSAFEKWYGNNEWGVNSYEELTAGQKKSLLFFGMVNNAYLIETLSNYYDGTLNEGTTIRRETAVGALDVIPREMGDELPNGKFWQEKREREEGILLLKDETNVCLVHLLQKSLDFLSINNDDFEIMTGGVKRKYNDAHIFDIPVIERDITCKNGYINVLESVLLPPSNMASFIQENENTQIFADMLARFCAPYYSEALTLRNSELLEETSDSIFVKHFFTQALNGGRVSTPEGDRVDPDYQLSFDPGWNLYQPEVGDGQLGAIQSDMGAMFVPSDSAMLNYLTEGSGKVILDRFGAWENVPDDIVNKFVKRHMRSSFVSSVPSRFNLLVDENNISLPVSQSDIVSSYIGTNGIVYITDKVYPPNDYVSVYAPVLMSDNTVIMQKAIETNDFALYVNSLESNYSLFVPTDEFFEEYIDPFTFGLSLYQGALKYWWDTEDQMIKATVYYYDAETNTVGDSVSTITNEGFISNRLVKILDTHIVVGDVEDGSKYYLSKGGDVVITEGSGPSMKIQGGYDAERNTQCNIIDIYNQENGKTYLIDKPISPTVQSVYKVLNSNPEFEAFFDLIYGFETKDTFDIFVTPSEPGIDENVKFLNTFNYTVYVPTNDSINAAILRGEIPPWESVVDGSGDTLIVGINQMTNTGERRAAVQKLNRILRYHFQDNSVFISGNAVSGKYQSATIKNNDSATYFNTYLNKYYKIGVEGDGSNLDLTTEVVYWNEVDDGNGNITYVKDGTKEYTASVITDNGLYNILAQDYSFNQNPKKTKDIDGSGTSTFSNYNTSRIVTSATAVIHQVNKVLSFEPKVVKQ